MATGVWHWPLIDLCLARKEILLESQRSYLSCPLNHCNFLFNISIKSFATVAMGMSCFSSLHSSPKTTDLHTSFSNALVLFCICSQHAYSKERHKIHAECQNAKLVPVRQSEQKKMHWKDLLYPQAKNHSCGLIEKWRNSNLKTNVLKHWKREGCHRALWHSWFLAIPQWL